MAHIKLGNQEINNNIKKNDGQVYIIAEIGQNHQGDMEIAKKMIKEAKLCGCDCVKFQKSELSEKFTKTALQNCYDGENSWGQTYGEHKNYLEFSTLQYKELQRLAYEQNIHFTASAMDEVSLEFLASLQPPFIKIGSGDANNFPLLKKCAQLSCPLIISTGMQHLNTIDEIVHIMKHYSKSNYALMHCVSSYPTAPENCNLRMIEFLQQRFPNVIIGYSGHEHGVLISLAAVLLGARILERHFTLNKTLKGTDHKCSLEPQEMHKLVRSIRAIKKSDNYFPSYENLLINIQNILQPTDIEFEILQNALKPIGNKEILPCELPCKLKLGKSLVAREFLPKGKHLLMEDICIKVSEPNGLPAEDLKRVLGAHLCCNVEKDMPIMCIIGINNCVSN